MSAWKLLEDLLVLKASGIVEPFEVRLHTLKHLTNKKDTNYYIDFPSAICLYYDFEAKVYQVMHQDKETHKLEIGKKIKERSVALDLVRDKLKKVGYI